MTSQTTKDPATHYTDSPDGMRVIPPSKHSPDVVGWLVGEKYPDTEIRTVPCSVPGCTSTTRTAETPSRDIITTCSREHMLERAKQVRKCACARAAMRVNTPNRLPPVCSDECAELRERWFGE